MRRIDWLTNITNLFNYVAVKDLEGNEYVLFTCCHDGSILQGIEDKTGFESFQNHIHLLSNIKKEEFCVLQAISSTLGNTILCQLKSQFPTKQFIVYISIKLHDAMIVRFHQKWEKELPYCNVNEFLSIDEKIYSFEN